MQSSGCKGRRRARAHHAGERISPPPGRHAAADNNLEHGELIVAIELPKSNFAKNSYYLKVRDRASYAFALVAVAAAVELDGSNIKQARVVLGSVAHKPWRSAEAEAALAGKAASEENFRAAAEAGAHRRKAARA